MAVWKLVEIGYEGRSPFSLSSLLFHGVFLFFIFVDCGKNRSVPPSSLTPLSYFLFLILQLSVFHLLPFFFLLPLFSPLISFCFCLWLPGALLLRSLKGALLPWLYLFFFFSPSRPNCLLCFSSFLQRLSLYFFYFFFLFFFGASLLRSPKGAAPLLKLSSSVF